MMKKAFYFTLKALFVLKIFKFLSWLFGRVKKRFDWKDQVNSKFMMSYPGKQTISIRILPNISRTKGNEALKFGQLVECNLTNIFFEKLYTKCDGETILRPFSKKPKPSKSLDQESKVLYVCFYGMPSSRLTKYIETTWQNICFYLI